jgi:hypothetical protein
MRCELPNDAPRVQSCWMARLWPRERQVLSLLMGGTYVRCIKGKDRGLTFDLWQ